MKKLVLGLVSEVLGTVLLAWPNMWLWNNVLVGAVDGINPIEFWQSLGITLLFDSLFKSISSK